MIRSLKLSERTAVQVGWDGHEYGLIPIGHNDELVISPSSSLYPKFINEQGSGTVVTFLGNSDEDNTFVPSGKPKGWLLKYLNTRFFRLSDERLKVLVRVPTGEEEEWPQSVEEAAERMRKHGPSFNLTVVYGTASVWDDAADKQGKNYRGTMPLPGNADIPSTNLHWWVLPSGSGSDVSSRTASGGSLAVLFQNELHDWKTAGQANPYFARLGVLFGKTRIAFIVEPLGQAVASDFVRARILVSGVPVLESEAWLLWTEQFRAAIPERIRQAMAEEQARLQSEDPDRAKRIQERLREIMQLLRPRRFRRNEKGTVRAAGPQVAGVVAEALPVERFSPKSAKLGGSARGIGAVLSELDEQSGTPASTTKATQLLRPRWVSELESDDLTIVNGNTNGIRDRAAALAGTDGRTANLLLLNKDFRGYHAILAAVNEWANAEGDSDKASRIESFAQEWIEQKMIEAVQGLRQLENGKTWLTEHYDDALSPSSLTAAFMADRYHTLREVKRAVASLRQAASA